MRNIKNIYNEMGQLDLQYEEMLEKATGGVKFRDIEEYAYGMFKYLLERHRALFISQYFSKESKQLTSHSNFGRFNKMCETLREELWRKVDNGDNIDVCLKSTEQLLELQTAMTEVVWREYHIYMQLRSQDHNSAYRQRVEKYSSNRDQT